MRKLGDSVSGALRTFGFWLANGTVGYPLLEGIDYSCIFREPSALEQSMAIYANVLRVDESGVVLNPRKAEMRAAQWIRSYVDQSYTVDPPFAQWRSNCTSRRTSRTPIQRRLKIRIRHPRFDHRAGRGDIEMRWAYSGSPAKRNGLINASRSSWRR